MDEQELIEEFLQGAQGLYAVLKNMSDNIRELENTVGQLKAQVYELENPTVAITTTPRSPYEKGGHIIYRSDGTVEYDDL